MTRTKFTAYCLSTLVLAWLNPPAGLSADSKKKAAEETAETIVVDVALDAATLSYSRTDAWASGPVRGDTYIINGRVYPGFAIPDGDTTNIFAADTEGSMGSLVCTGIFTADSAAIAAGAESFMASTHVLKFDSGDGMVTHGVEGSIPMFRALLGGTGQYSGAVGQVTEEVLGVNASGGKNLRFTFKLVRLNPQDSNPTPSARVSRKGR